MNIEKEEKNQKTKTIEQLNEKILSEQNQNNKIQQESIQLKHELKSIHGKYDTLQMELLQLREARTNEPILIDEPSSITAVVVPPVAPVTRVLRSKRSVHEDVILLWFFSTLSLFEHFI